MPKVFIVNQSCHDFSKAEKFGKLTFLSSGSVNRYATSKMFRAFEDEIKKSEKEDYILLSGMTIMSSIACAMFARKHKRLNLLLWKSRDKDYMERIINMEDWR